MATMDKIFDGYRARQAELEATFDSNPYARGIAWVEGQYSPLHEARIPLLDQGFLHSDLVYDVPSVFDGRFFRLSDHLDRLERSCAKLRLKVPIPRQQLEDTLLDMVAKSGLRDAYVSLIVTRGLQGVRGHTPGQTFVNNLYIFAQPFVWLMSPDEQPVGGKAVVTRTVRRISPGSVDPTNKNLQWGDLTRGMFEAADRGAVYPFLTDGDANLTEGSGYNIAFVKDGTVYTPDRGVLEGMTRRTVLEVAAANDLPVRVEAVPTEMAYTSDEIFMCTTAGGIMPVTEMDGEPVKDGKVGPVTKKIWDAYWAVRCDDAHNIEVDYVAGKPKGAAS